MTDSNIKKIGILGAGGQADEVESFLRNGMTVEFRAVSKDYLVPDDQRLVDIEAADQYETIPVVAAVGAPGVRRDMVTQWSGKEYIAVISEMASLGKGTVIGKGSVIAPGAVLSTNVGVGGHAIVNIGATISHDSRLGDFVTISPGAHIAGNVELGDGVFVGIGAIISNDIKVASGSVIGAGAVVMKDILEENSVVVGVPAKVIKRNTGWLREI